MDEIPAVAPARRARVGLLGGSRAGARWIAVAGGCGYSPIAPGTMGSLLAVLLFLLAAVFSTSPEPEASSISISLFPGASRSIVFAGYGLVVFGLFGLGCWAAGAAEHQFGHHDDGRIVIDEVVGQLIALSPLVWIAGATPLFEFSLGVVTGFVLFRLFDVWKPGAIGWAERRFEGGLGVMADDVLAGVHAALVLALILAWAPATGTAAATAAGTETATEAATEAATGTETATATGTGTGTATRMELGMKSTMESTARSGLLFSLGGQSRCESGARV